MQKIKAVVTDIEGTTSSIDFVKNILFPYALAQLEDYLQAHQTEPAIAAIIAEVAAELENKSLAAVIAQLQHWIETDQKKTALKALQGYIWEAGYQKNDYKAHLYPDTTPNITAWAQHCPIYVYSSGSIKAQKLFFTYSEAGDITHLFQGYFDTTTGAKKEAASYSKIATAIQLQPQSILFLSDCPAEIAAATAAGFQTCHILREQSSCEHKQNNHKHNHAQSFNQVTRAFFS